MKNFNYLLFLLPFSALAQIEKNKATITLYNTGKTPVTIYATNILSSDNDTVLISRPDTLVKKLINISSPRFITASIGNRIQSMYLDSEYNLRIRIEPDNTLSFEGWGSDINKYLADYDNFRRYYQFKSNIFAHLRGKDFFDATEDFENKFMKFHEKEITFQKMGDERVAMLEKKARLYTLSLKTNKYLAWQNQRDPTVQYYMQEVLPEVEESLKDTIAFQLHEPDYLNILNNYAQILLLKTAQKVYEEKKDYTDYPARIYEQIKSLNVSANLKEYLLALAVEKSLPLINKFPAYGALYNLFTNNYYNSAYIRNIDKQATEFTLNLRTVNNEAPDISGITADGKEIKLTQLLGKPVVVNIWATECGSCSRQQPLLEALQKKFDKITFLHISVDTDMQQWQKAIHDKKAVNGITVWQTQADSAAMWESYLSLGLPRYMIINAEGKIVRAKVSIEEIEQILKNLPVKL